MVSQVLTHNTSQSLPIVARKINSSRILSSKCAYYKSFSEYPNFSWPKFDTHIIEPVLLGPCLSFVPNLQSLGGIPTTWAIGNLYFQGILGCRSVSILALVSITSNQGGGYFSGNPRLPQLGLLAAPQPYTGFGLDYRQSGWRTYGSEIFSKWARKF